jgi:hypothetical protein
MLGGERRLFEETEEDDGAMLSLQTRPCTEGNQSTESWRSSESQRIKRAKRRLEVTGQLNRCHAMQHTLGVWAERSKHSGTTMNMSC